MKKRARRRRKRGSDQKSITGRGVQIAESGLILDLGSGRYKVSSQSVPGAFYDVTVTDHVWKCTCPYHARGRGRRCKHAAAVQGLVENVGRVRRRAAEIAVPDGAARCDGCGGTDVRPRERRRKKRGGVSVMYACGGCGKKFVHAPGFKGRHYDADVITDALFQMAAGLPP